MPSPTVPILSRISFICFLSFLARISNEDLLLTSMALVQLDVASPWMTAAQITAGEVAARQLDLEYVVAAWLALVAHAHPRGAGLAVNINIVVNDAAVGVVRINGVSGDGRGLHVPSVAVV